MGDAILLVSLDVIICDERLKRTSSRWACRDHRSSLISYHRLCRSPIFVSGHPLTNV